VEYGDSTTTTCDCCGQSVKKEYAISNDAGTLAMDVHDIDWERLSEKFEETEEGYLKGRACVTTVGVYSYLVDGKIQYHLRPRTEVMDWDSLSSLKLKPLTNGHPKTGITVDNFKKNAIGITGSDIYTDNDRVYIEILVTDADAIAEIKQGKRSLSCGYSRKLIDQEGVHNGSRYDKVMANIRYDHVALVDRGRAGDDAVMVLDGIVFQHDEQDNINTSQETNMKKIIIGDSEIEVQDSVADHIEKNKIAMDEALSLVKTKEKELSTLQASFDSAQEQIGSLKGELEKTKLALDEAPAKHQEQMKARLALIGKAKAVGVDLVGDEDEAEIKAKVIKKVSPNISLDEKDQAYIEVRFDLAVETLSQSVAQDEENAKIINGDSSDDSQVKPLSCDEAQAKYIKQLENAHQEVKD
jgi:hypothetical protein